MGEEQALNLRLSSVTKRLGGFLLGPVDLALEGGEYVAVVGPNGAGKTTLLYLISGFMQPDAGDIYMGGRRVNGSPPEERRAAFVFSEPVLFPNMSVAENLEFAARGNPGRLHDVRRALGIDRLEGRRAWELSTGQARRVEMARALLSEPSFLLMDEPYSAIDPSDRGAVAAYMKGYASATGTAVLLTTHHMEDTERADRVLSMAGGRLEAPRQRL
ncbi:MAG: ATP-binding cassette domain-containing protein [Nitrososphaerota archaeon]|nr:ATP-binding cassette domain-containing protein [Nitrososphaerota archaeon]MDG6939812.1 ATP-binding cassette domain-containing protein [Nitrososphaerota archaeon]